LKRDYVDFFLVPDNQLEMHARLLNWARYVTPGWSASQHPMWRQGKSNSRQWHSPVVREDVDQLDGFKIERAVGLLPIPHREAIRWHYVHRSGPMKIRRQLGVTAEGLMKLVNDARAMLRNRGV
jgi:DNA-directed RNA polymerase specialized sigma24 family protein